MAVKTGDTIQAKNEPQKQIWCSFQIMSSMLSNILENVSSGKIKRVFCFLELDVEKENIYMES